MLLSGAGLLQAGSPAAVTPVTPAASRETWITPVIDIRVRYEFADVDGLDPSHALTARERLALRTMDWHGLSAFVEGEFSQAIIGDYNGGAAAAEPFDPRNSLVADPETNELNQGYVQYNGHDNLLRLGRQRLIYDNAAFIGNVGWRQNEQTYDAVSLANQCVKDLTIHYAYLSQVNRIFGSEATNPLPNATDVGSDTHLFKLSYAGVSGWTFGAYGYLMDFDNLRSWNNDTFGAIIQTEQGGFTWRAEGAYQENDTDDSAWYAHGSVSRSFGGHALTLGVEFLDAGFRTPLATLHAFNGFADAFVARRTNGTHGGLTNPYLSHSMPIFWDIKWTNVLHAFGDNALDASYGWEYDTVFAKKFDDHFTGLIKLAFFESQDERKYPTATRCSVEVSYTF